MSAPCPRLFEVEALRDGRLEGSERTRFEQHLRSCPVCSSETQTLQALAQALRGGATEDDELHVRRERTRLLAAFDRSLLEPESTRWPHRRGWLLTAAAAALVVMAALWVGPRLGSSSAATHAVVHAGDSARWSRIADTQRELLRLDQGELRIVVTEGPDKRPLLLRLPDGELEDVGTTFSVRVEHRRTTHVSVVEGRVLLRLEGHAPVLLAAGEHWTAPSLTAARVPQAPAPTEPIATVADSTQQARAARPASPALAASPASPDASSRDFKRAVAMLNSGQHLSAATEFRRFIDNYPPDARTEDAAYLRALALHRTGDLEATRSAARAYLRRYPSGFRRAEVERLAE
jgi:hypothetical protein